VWSVGGRWRFPLEVRSACSARIQIPSPLCEPSFNRNPSETKV